MHIEWFWWKHSCKIIMVLISDKSGARLVWGQINIVIWPSSLNSSPYHLNLKLFNYMHPLLTLRVPNNYRGINHSGSAEMDIWPVINIVLWRCPYVDQFMRLDIEIHQPSLCLIPIHQYIISAPATIPRTICWTLPRRPVPCSMLIASDL